MKVLIADDHPKMRDFIQRTIRPLCAETVEVGDGRSAVVAFLQHRPDWVLLDIEMPGMDGVAATREILRSEPGARIIIVTAHQSPALQLEARAAGALAFVSKTDLQRLRILLQPSPPRTE